MLWRLPWLQLRIGWRSVEILYYVYGLPLYGIRANECFKIIWDVDVIFSSCGERTQWCGCPDKRRRRATITA